MSSDKRGLSLLIVVALVIAVLVTWRVIMWLTGFVVHLVFIAILVLAAVLIVRHYMHRSSRGSTK